MHIDDNPDCSTIWKLAHNWVNADPDKSDENSLSLELRKYIHYLLEASQKGDISVRTSFRKIFIDESFISFVVDFFHILKFKSHLRSNKINKNYL